MADSSFSRELTGFLSSLQVSDELHVHVTADPDMAKSQVGDALCFRPTAQAWNQPVKRILLSPRLNTARVICTQTECCFNLQFKFKQTDL